MAFSPLAVEACIWEKSLYKLDSHFGPELAFGLALHEQYPERQIVLSKRAVSGSTLANDWAPGRDGYRALLDDLTRIRDAYPDSTVVPSGLLWLQGEADAKESEDARTYGENLKRLIHQLRKDTGSHLPVVVVALPGEGRPFQPMVDSALESTARDWPLVSYLHNDAASNSRSHLPIGSEGGVSRLSESEFEQALGQLLLAGQMDTSLDVSALHVLRNQVCLHYTSAAQLRIGARAAELFASMKGRPPAPWPLGWRLGVKREGSTMYNWFWEQEELLLARQPNATELDTEHHCFRVRVTTQERLVRQGMY